jgi:hypothetical protein
LWWRIINLALVNRPPEYVRTKNVGQQKRGQIAIAPLVARDTPVSLLVIARVDLFVGGEPKCLVAAVVDLRDYQGPTHCGSKLVSPQLRLWVGLRQILVFRVEELIPQILIGGAMQLVGARLERHVHNRAAGLTVLCIEVSGLHIDLLNGVHRGLRFVENPGVGLVLEAPSMRISSAKLCRPFWLVTGQDWSRLTEAPGTRRRKLIGFRIAPLKSIGSSLIFSGVTEVDISADSVFSMLASAWTTTVSVTSPTCNITSCVIAWLTPTVMPSCRYVLNPGCLIDRP